MTDGPIAESKVEASFTAWRSALPALAFAILAILFLNWDTAERIVSIWIRSETFAHGFLVPPIVAWLIWRRRMALAALTPRSSLAMLPLTALAALAWLLGDLTATNAVTFVALASLLVLTVPVILGFSVARFLVFPLGYFFFAVPVGEFVMPQMMEWTADFTTQALVLTGVPVYREGLNFIIPSGSWSVAEACSGLRYLIASVVVGSLYAYLSYRSPRRRLMFVALSFVVPIVANWLRAYMIVMLGHLSGNKLAVGVDHLIYGWLFFGVVMVMMFVIGARWAEPPEPAGNVTVNPGNGHAGYAPVRVWSCALIFVAIASLPHLWRAEIERSEVRRGGTSVSLSLPAPDGWQTKSAEIGWRPAFNKPVAEMSTEYVHGEQRVGVYIGYYFNQDYEGKLIASSNVLVRSDDREWMRVANGVRQSSVDNQSLAVRTAELRGPNDRRLVVWQWYWINGHLTNSDYMAKIYQALSRLLGKGDDSAVVVLYAPKDLSGGTEAVLESFLDAASPAIDTALRQAKLSER